MSSLWDRFLAQPTEEIALRASLVLLFLYPADDPGLGLPVRALTAVMLIGPGLARSFKLWVAVTLALGLALWPDWHSIDNHDYLLFYWALVCTIAVRGPDTQRILAWNGRLLIAFVFALATIWKLAGGQYLDGTFFSFELLTDSRLAILATPATGLLVDQINANRELINALMLFPGAGLTVTLQSAPGIEAWARILSYGTVAIEGALAVAFIALYRRPDLDLPNWMLIAFNLATYSLAPVLGFGFVLTVMGFAQCPADRRDTRIAYVLSFLFVQLAPLRWIPHVILTFG
jgi:hypothetical protein